MIGFKPVQFRMGSVFFALTVVAVAGAIAPSRPVLDSIAFIVYASAFVLGLTCLAAAGSESNRVWLGFFFLAVSLVSALTLLDAMYWRTLDAL